MPTLADLLRTPGTPANTVKTTLADLLRGYNREAVAGLLGAPVDMANTVSNLTRAGIGYTGHKLGMLASPPDLIEKPALGSDWIYERLPGQPALTGSGAENTGRMLGAMLSPPVVMQAAPGVARVMGRALQEKVPGMATGYMDAMGMSPAALPRVDDIPSLVVGPTRITPKVIAEGRPLYRETNIGGLDDLMRGDNQHDYHKAFVTDAQELAIGQGANKGVFVEFRPNSLSGAEHIKPMTGAMAGKEYVTDVIAPKSIQSITLSAGDLKKLRGITARKLSEFNREQLPDGRVRFTRKPEAD